MRNCACASRRLSPTCSTTQILRLPRLTCSARARLECCNPHRLRKVAEIVPANWHCGLTSDSDRQKEWNRPVCGDPNLTTNSLFNAGHNVDRSIKSEANQICRFSETRFKCMELRRGSC